MDDRYLEQLKLLSSKEQSSETVAHMATILALKEVTDILERVVIRQDKMEDKIDDMFTKVIRIEEKSSSDLTKENTIRIDKLEKDIAVWKTRFLTLTAASVAVWAVFGNTISNWIGLIHG